MISEFKPAILFLVKFIAIYFVGNILYGVFIENFEHADPVTHNVTVQTAELLKAFGFSAEVHDDPLHPTVNIRAGEKTVISVFEGCNGINVMIVFVAFIAAYGGLPVTIAWFVPLGLCSIHTANLFRISLLYYTALHRPQYFYYFHKYFFTAILYLVVFTLWFLWVAKLNASRKTNVRA